MNNYWLKLELPTYMAVSDGTLVDTNKLEWWEKYAHQIHNWSSAYKANILLQPSSAAAE